jgi:hypothetical protein
VTLVEFALMAPLIFLMVMGIVVASLVVTNQTQLNNVVRDGARLAGLCGGSARQAGRIPRQLSTCSTAAIESYIQSNLDALPANTLSFTVSVTSVGGALFGSDLESCSQGRVITIDASFDQPLYLPLVGKILSNNSHNNDSRTLSADAQAVCTQ